MSSVFPTQTNLLLCATESTLAVKYCFIINLFLTLNMQHIHSAAFPFPALPPSLSHSRTHTAPPLCAHHICLKLFQVSTFPLFKPFRTLFINLNPARQLDPLPSTLVKSCCSSLAPLNTEIIHSPP